MYQQAVGFSPSKSLLSGLSRKGDAGAYGKGLGMQAAADLNLARDQQNQKFATQQMEDASRQRMADAQTKAQGAENAVRERSAAGEVNARHQAFTAGEMFDYEALRRRPALNLRQSLISGIARDF